MKTESQWSNFRGIARSTCKYILKLSYLLRNVVYPWARANKNWWFFSICIEPYIRSQRSKQRWSKSSYSFATVACSHWEASAFQSLLAPLLTTLPPLKHSSKPECFLLVLSVHTYIPTVHRNDHINTKTRCVFTWRKILGIQTIF